MRDHNSWCICVYLLLIAVSDITSFSEHKQIRGKAVSIWNVGYPDSGIANNADNVCSVTVSCRTSIVVSALDLNLTHNASGRCQQHIVIADGHHKSGVDCNNNSYYRASTLYTSRSHFVRVHLIIDNNLPTKAGRFWVQFHGKKYQVLILLSGSTDGNAVFTKCHHLCLVYLNIKSIWKWIIRCMSNTSTISACPGVFRV